jgi:large subunit ribosomal protein L25
MISHLKNEIELTCNAQNLPEFIEIDMKDIEIGSNIMQSQIILPEGVSLSINILNNQDQPVASVNVTRAALDIDDELSEGDQDESEESSDEASETSDAADESSPKEES